MSTAVGFLSGSACIEQTAQTEGWQVDSLIFDRGLLRKCEGFGETEPKSLLCMQENAKASLGVDIEIAVEHFST